MKISDAKVLEVIAASAKAAIRDALGRLSDEEVRELHALMYVGRDGMALEDARRLDRLESRDIVESTIASKEPLNSYLRAGLARVHGVLA